MTRPDPPVIVSPPGDRERTKAEEGIREAMLEVWARAGVEVGASILQKTPGRVIRAWLEMTRGYLEDPKEILQTQFDVDHPGGLVVLRGIDFASVCEHHLIPFRGTAAVVYLPQFVIDHGTRVVGLSKLARLVQCRARRLQIQERLVAEIASDLETHLQAPAIGVVLRASHGCMTCRGVQQPRAEMVTSAFRGAFLDEPFQLKAEALVLLGLG